jgi:hypothetical protein
MPKYALLENSIVQRVEEHPQPPGPEWQELSLNEFSQYPDVGWAYSPEYGVFVTPSPFPSWSFNPSTLNWDAPITYPKLVWPIIPVWNESTQQWDQINVEQE